MIKKIVLCLFALLLVGCGVETRTIDEANGDSKTYLFFKDFDPNNYYVELWDRNNNKNDDTKIIMARSDDEYYYEINGSTQMIVIQKDGYMYTLDPQMKNYNKVESPIEDYAYGVLPNDMVTLRTAGYETGEEKVYGKNYIYEKYTNDNDESTYYFDGDDLVYIRYKSPEKTVFFKYNLTKDEVDSTLFEIPDDYLEITYQGDTMTLDDIKQFKIKIQGEYVPLSVKYEYLKGLSELLGTYEYSFFACEKRFRILKDTFKNEKWFLIKKILFTVI